MSKVDVRPLVEDDTVIDREIQLVDRRNSIAERFMRTFGEEAPDFGVELSPVYAQMWHVVCYLIETSDDSSCVAINECRHFDLATKESLLEFISDCGDDMAPWLGRVRSLFNL